MADSAGPTSAKPSAVPEPVAPPGISVPKGGGAIRGIGEKFAADPAAGTGICTIPIPVSPGRSGFGPSLQLSYDSGRGNGPFGFGWALDLPAVTRRTDKGLPRYQDGAESDVFTLSGAEDLVPVLLPDGTRQVDEQSVPGVTIHRYRPRVEGLFARIERWTDRQSGAAHWRVISHDHVTTVYGRTPGSTVAEGARVFSWLICESHDDQGNAVVYEYVPEDDSNVDTARPGERNRSRGANRYLTRIRYGNTAARPVGPEIPSTDWLFEVVLDYDQGYLEEVPADPDRPADEQHRWVRAGAVARQAWAARPDPFSQYRSGFEIRTHRRCHRVLMFHRFPELGAQPCLVRSTELDYADLDLTRPVTIEAELAHHGSTRFASFLTSVTQRGFVADPPRPASDGDGDGAGGGSRTDQRGRYLAVAMPAVRCEYSKAVIRDEVRVLDAESGRNLPAGVGGPAYQWVDLDGEGTPGVLSEQAGAWFFKANLGEGRLGPVRPTGTLPSQAALTRGRQQLLDLAGDGQLDLVDFGGATPGFYRRTPDETWESLRPFCRLPTEISWQDPNTRLVDLAGDGHADVLITEQDALSWHRSLGEEGFGPARRVPAPPDEEHGPRLLFADGTGSVYLADMSGDGLTDLVRVRNGEVSYWPNLGYGRFGPRVSLDNAPRFDRPDQFDQRRVRLADIDGSGTTDVIYLGQDGVHLYPNQAGNRLGDARSLHALPLPDDLAQVGTADLLGNGTACLVWSSPLPAHAGRPLRYVDLMGGAKPHLLVGMTNGLGGETRVRYAPSTRFALADRRAGRPWRGKLPFPVHVVERVESVDRVSRHRFVSRYAYRDGYFDPVEREFRGFGRVDQWDTEEFAALAPADAVAGAPPGARAAALADGDATNLDAASHVPPVLTRTWFHTGRLPGDDLFADGYREPGEGEAAPRRLPGPVLPAGLPLPELREACRALRGRMLRQETYGLDGTAKAAHPYLVTEQNFTVRRLQPAAGHRHAVFVADARESLTHTYERNPADPRVEHALTLEVDDHGNVLRSAAIAYGRRRPDATLPAVERAAQAATHATCVETRVTNPVDTALDHRAPLPWESRTFELTGLTAPAGADGPLSFDAVLAATRGATPVPFEGPAGPGAPPGRRQIDAVRTLYRADDLSGPLPPGVLEPRALVHERYKLALTPGLVATVYGDRVTDAMLRESGYVRQAGDDGWWIPAGRVFLSPGGDDPASAELSYARAHFFRPCRFRDPFHGPGRNTESVITYDRWDLLPMESRDALGSRLTVGERDSSGRPTAPGNDYRVLKPRLVTDCNGNRSAVAFDALGLVVGTAVMGKAGGAAPEGDSLDGFRPDLTGAAARHALADPHAVLGRATSRLVHDLFAYERTRTLPQPGPASVHTLIRTVHDADLAAGQSTPVVHEFSYSDGLGREIQRKVQAPPAPGDPQAAARWTGSGWTVFDNKGRPVRQYEPFFSATHSFEADVRLGVGPVTCYDPVGRVVATLYPDHTWEKLVADAWRRDTWDVTDTVLIADPRTDPDVGGHFTRLPAGDTLPTWYARRADGELGPRERAAAAKAAVIAGTPLVSHADPMARQFVTVSHNRFRHHHTGGGRPVTEEFHRSRVVFDIQGNVREVVDPDGRAVMRYSYDLTGARIRQSGMDAGERWTLNDVTGRAVYVWDSREHRARTVHDPLRRPVESYLSEGGGAERLVERRVHGETLADAEALNLRGQVARLYDQAGVVTSGAYDFKGNLLSGQRRLAADYRGVLDWAGEVRLEEETYTSRTGYDALNRPVRLSSPRSDRAGARTAVVQHRYGEGGLLDRVDAWFDLDEVPAGLLDARTADLPAVTRLDYDARGRRTRIEYGNGAATTYEYDPLTFRLSRLRTAREGAVLQDLRYTYDPGGSITHLEDRAQQAVFFRNRQVGADADYTYDALSRLIEATGREHLGQTGRAPEPHSVDDTRRAGITLGASDGAAMARYVESYRYDAVGNILSMRHRGGDPAHPGWTRHYAYQEPSRLEEGRAGNRLSSTTVGGATEWHSVAGDGYDPHGNPLRMPHLPVLRWDFRDQLRMSRRQATGADGGPAEGERTWYVYDSTGARVRKVTELPGGRVKDERVYLAGFEIYRRHGADPLVRETLHLTDDKRRLVLVDTRTEGDDGSPERLVRYQLGNHLGSSTVELGGEGQLLSYEEYTPYGATSYQAVRAATQPPKRYRYLGRERDEETGLAYHGARYYAPWLGRWTSSDPAGLRDGVNTYTYVNGNPVNRIDLTGKFEISWKEALIGAAATVVVIGAVALTAGAAAPVLVPALAGVLGVSEATVVTGAAVAGTVYGTYTTAKSVGEIQYEIRTGVNAATGEKVSDAQISREIGSAAVGAVATVFGARGLKVGGPPGGSAPAVRVLTPSAAGAGAVEGFGPRLLPPLAALPVRITAAPSVLPVAVASGTASYPPRLMSMMSGDGGGGGGEDDVPLIEQEQPGASGPRSVDPQGEPLTDPAPPAYKRGHPSQPVVDHIENRARGGHATAPENLHVKTWEANSRKGGFEGNYTRELKRLVAQGLNVEDARSVLQGEHEYILNDVHARPVDPHALESAVDQQLVSVPDPDLVCR